MRGRRMKDKKQPSHHLMIEQNDGTTSPGSPCESQVIGIVFLRDGQALPS